MFKSILLLVLCSIFVLAAAEPTPLVLWHGMGDSCCNPLSMGSIMDMVKEQIPGIYIHSLQIGDGMMEDILNGFLKPIHEQIEMACNMIKNDSKLAGGFNAMGFSQGGQFLRAVVQQCDGIQMKNLITFGGQHQGVYGFPHCPNSLSLCTTLNYLLNKAAYLPTVQAFLVQAQYWHNPLDETDYKAKNIFLPDVNNENTVNEQYKQRLMSLNKFVMVRFNQDKMVQPIESEWFGFYAPGQEEKVLTLKETELYQADRLGLQEMNSKNQLVFLSTDGDHLQISTQWFIDNIIQYLH